jgi:hypothetical protein
MPGRALSASRARRGILGCLTLCVLVLCFGVPKARADEVVHACGTYPNEVFYESDAVGFEEEQTCGQVGGVMIIYTSSAPKNGVRAYWATNAPSGLFIDDASVQQLADNGMNDSGPYGGGLFWGPSASNGIGLVSTMSAAGPFGDAYGTTGFPSNDFGFQIVCGANDCGTGTGTTLRVGEVDLTVGETSGPSLAAGGLWDQTGWVRGPWPITVSGYSASGVCSLSASIGGDPVAVSQANPQDAAAWHQCSSAGLTSTLNTSQAADGTDTLTVTDGDAAGESDQASKTIHVDNVTPQVSLTGPSTALSTSGTQYVTDTVTTGSSGADGADCTVDGGAPTFYAGASSQIPVSGVGEHTVTCTGLNNAMSSGGQRASSVPESLTVDIQQPTEEAITFSKIADTLKCHTLTRRVRILGRPHMIELHGHKVSVRRVRYVKRHVRKCRARTVRRRLLVPLKRHGKIVRRHGRIVRVRRIQRVVLLPHRVHKTVRHIRHGRGTTVSGVLLLSDGTPLSGQTITVLGAPNAADPQFAAVSTATTNANGFWVAKIPKGPSRLLEAQYGGTPTEAPVSSTTVRTIVPAKIRILSATKRVAWGRTATLKGRVYGGYIPRGGINIRLRYGYRHQSTTYGVKTHVGPGGRFTTTFTFGPGDPRDHIRFHFQFATLPGGNYPFHTAASNTVVVEVGGHPRPAAHRRHQR